MSKTHVADATYSFLMHDNNLTELNSAVSASANMAAASSNGISSPAAGAAGAAGAVEESSTLAMQCNASDALLETAGDRAPSVTPEIGDIGSQLLLHPLINEELPNHDEFDDDDEAAQPDANKLATAAAGDKNDADEDCQHGCGGDPRFFMISSSHTKCTSHQVLLRTCHGYMV